MKKISILFVSKPNSGQLRSLVNNVSALCTSLQSLGSDKDIVNTMLMYIVMQKVDVDKKRKWKELIDFSQFPTWDDCFKVLERRWMCPFGLKMPKNLIFVLIVSLKLMK